ncbi:hypothetical protein J2S43_000983 [Catenuloplanes nepalensis]|uniref:DUF3558 domain-containing protein n=1 Tax=Catenuloplanes nepalensis TaxID=587533 RepID=A0ABT9MN37_9ACTN|nr:hypothetical protein [Catenuloplanes nepalensis]MDP9792471.1 hypothetical protein [Catenuloplanes nepalensis]
MTGTAATPDPAGTTRLQAAPPLSDCAALAPLVPASISHGMGVDTGAPAPAAGDEAYLVGCGLVGPSAADARLRLGMQINIIRPRVDPYESKPLADWLRTKPAQLTRGTDCTAEAPWAQAPNGSRCVRDAGPPPQRTVVVAGAGRGTAVQVRVTAMQLDQANPVPADVAQAASDRAAEETYKAISATV